MTVVTPRRRPPSGGGTTIRLQVEAADAATASLVEAGVDDVRIVQG